MRTQGLPYRAINKGPPKPPCNQQRVKRLRELDVMDKPPDPEIGVQLRWCGPSPGTSCTTFAYFFFLRALKQRCARGPEHIVQLACTVFGTANALVALLEGEVHAPPPCAFSRAAHARRGWATRTRKAWHASLS